MRLPAGVVCGAMLLAAGGCETRRISVPLLVRPARPLVLWREPFDVLEPRRWREASVRGRTAYRVTDLEGRRCLEARSQQGGSVLLSAVRFDPSAYKWFSWSWRVEQLVEGEALGRKSGSDAAARVYVYFDTAALPWQKRSLDYVWSATLPVGTILSSAFSAESKIIVVESGSSALGHWRAVERNLEDDYARCFGNDDRPDVVAIGLMTDTDNTASAALAYYDDLAVSRVPAMPPRPGCAPGAGPCASERVGGTLGGGMGTSEQPSRVRKEQEP